MPSSPPPVAKESSPNKWKRMQEECSREAKQLAAALNSPDATEDSSNEPRSPARKKRQVIVFHQHCIISAYSCCLMQAKPVVFEASPEEKLTLNNAIGQNTKCIRKIQKKSVFHMQ